MSNTKWGALLCGLLAVAGSAHAGDVVNAEEPAAQAEAGPQYGALIVGVTGTSNYIVGGLTQTDDKPAVQPFIEYNAPFGAYAGLWGSTVDFSPFTDDAWEIDAYAGYRNTFGKLSVDASYWRYYYDKTGYYGDAVLLGSDYQVTEKLKLGGQVKFDFTLDDQIFSPRVAFTPAESWTIGGKYEFARKGDGIDWDAGVTKALNQSVSLDLRYYDSNFDRPKIVLSLTAAIDAFSAFAD